MATLLSDGTSRSVQRVEAVHVLGQLGAQNKQVASLLAVALHSADDSLRAAAAAALGVLGVGDGLVLRALMAATGDDEPDVRAAALEALTRLRPDSLTVHIASRLVRQDTSTLVRVTAVYAVAVSNRLDAQIVSTLEVALHDSQPQVRRAAAIALSRFGSAAQSALDALRSVSDDSVASVRQAAEDAIRTITGHHR
jgi:HEAT repeat protein